MIVYNIKTQITPVIVFLNMKITGFLSYVSCDYVISGDTEWKSVV